MGHRPLQGVRLRDRRRDRAGAAALVRRARTHPAHINSDVCISDRELIFCNGASETIVMIDLASFSSYRILDERPGLRPSCAPAGRPPVHALDTLTRGSVVTNGHHYLRALRVARGSLLDSVYACQLSADQIAAVHRQPRAEHDHGLRLPG